jgi:hypothetical protein
MNIVSFAAYYKRDRIVVRLNAASGSAQI